jgi:shikimate dehydrogenase
MYPDCGVSPVDLDVFPHLEGVLDVIYNPARTQLLMDAQHRGIIAVNGLRMLVAQAKAAAECFTGAAISDDRIDGVYSRLKAEMENIILIGMPGCGKSTVGQLVAAELGREYVDADAEIEKRAQKSIPRIFAEDGEAVFRMLETQVLAEFGKQSGLVIATGGGCVTEPHNFAHLHQNGCIFWVQRERDKLATDGRPLSVNLREMYNARRPMYNFFADAWVDNNDSPEDAAQAIIALLVR